MFGSLFGTKKDKEKELEVSETKASYSDDGDMSLDEQIAWLKHNVWLRGEYVKGNKNILIMDDREEIISSIIDDLKSLASSDHFSLEDYNVIAVSTKMAGFNVIDILDKAKDIEIHYALLDIILGGKKSVDGKRKMVDGVDISIELMENYPSIDLLFFSGCIIETTNDPTHFKTRFDNYTGDDMNNFIMPKDIAFEDELEKLSEFFNGF